jgi:hypothetical protein
MTSNTTGGPTASHISVNQVNGYSGTTPVPEPSTLALCGLGLAGVLARSVRRAA